MVKPNDSSTLSTADMEKAERKASSNQHSHMPFEFWMEDVLGPLTIAQTILSTIILALGVACTVVEACKLGTGIWVGVLTLCSAIFGLLAVRNPYSQGFFVAYLVSSVVGCASACVLAYVTGVETVFNALQIKASIGATTVTAENNSGAFVGVAALNGVLLSLSVGFIICCTVSCMRMCVKMREPDPCCTQCTHEDFPGPVIYMTMGPQSKQPSPAMSKPDANSVNRRRSRSK